MFKRINRFISALESLADSMSRIAQSLEDAPVDFTWQQSDSAPTWSPTPPIYSPPRTPNPWEPHRWWDTPLAPLKITCETGKAHLSR